MKADQQSIFLQKSSTIYVVIGESKSSAFIFLVYLSKKNNPLGIFSQFYIERCVFRTAWRDAISDSFVFAR